MFELRPFNRKNNISYFNPFHEMENFERHFFENPFGLLGSMSEFKTDITDNGNEYILVSDLPGFKKEDIHLELSGDILTVSAERHSEYEDKDKKNNYIRCERSFGSYTRQFDVSGVKTDEIRAKYADGILTLKLPKKAISNEESRQLNIE